MKPYPFRITLALLTATLFFAIACSPVTYKSQRNVTVDQYDNTEENTALAAKVVEGIDPVLLRANILNEFPGVDEKQLDTLYIKSTGLEVGGTKQIVVQAGITFTDQNFPANEIMDFVQAQIKQQLPAN